jgi:acyl carrier protein
MTEMGLRIRRLLVENLRLDGLDPETIADDQPLFAEGLGLDSIDALELVVALEKEFGIAIGNQDVKREALASVAAIERLVQARLQPTRAANV